MIFSPPNLQYKKWTSARVKSEPGRVESNIDKRDAAVIFMQVMNHDQHVEFRFHSFPDSNLCIQAVTQRQWCKIFHSTHLCALGIGSLRVAGRPSLWQRQQLGLSRVQNHLHKKA